MPSTQSINKGAIAYFQGDCPNGWELYSPAQERVIIGSSSRYKIGSTGGQERVTLTKGQMPRHDHSNGIYNKLMSVTGQGTPTSVDGIGSGQPELRYTGTIQNEGNGEPISIMQPYIALKACQKTSEDEVDLSSYVQLQDFNIIKQQLSNIPDFDEFVRTSDLNPYSSQAFVYQNFFTKQDMQAFFALKTDIPSMENVVYQNQMNQYVQRDELTKLDQIYIKQDDLPNFENFVQYQDITAFTTQEYVQQYIASQNFAIQTQLPQDYVIQSQLEQLATKTDLSHANISIQSQLEQYAIKTELSEINMLIQQQLEQLSSKTNSSQVIIEDLEYKINKIQENMTLNNQNFLKQLELEQIQNKIDEIQSNITETTQKFVKQQELEQIAMKIQVSQVSIQDLYYKIDELNIQDIENKINELQLNITEAIQNFVKQQKQLQKELNADLQKLNNTHNLLTIQNDTLQQLNSNISIIEARINNDTNDRDSQFITQEQLKDQQSQFISQDQLKDQQSKFISQEQLKDQQKELKEIKEFVIIALISGFSVIFTILIGLLILFCKYRNTQKQNEPKREQKQKREQKYLDDIEQQKIETYKQQRQELQQQLKLQVKIQN